MLTLSETPDFTPFGEFMISPIHYNYIHNIICQSKDYVYEINDSGLFAWISLDCFVVDLFYLIK